MVVVLNFPPPTEGIKHLQPRTSVYVNNRFVGKGSLYIAESLMSFIDESGKGFSLEYPHIAIHAISRDLTAYPQECLYVMLDQNIDTESEWNAEVESDSDCEDDDKSEHEMTEIRYVPDDRGMLDAMFHAMSICQALHPDPQDSLSEDEDELFQEAEADGGEPAEDCVDPLFVNNEQDTTNGFSRSEAMDTEEGQFEDAEPEN